jgi:hypothetical protein
MVEICQGAVLWSQIRSILVTRDLDVKSSNDAANKINSRKRNAASNLLRFAYLSGHYLFILLYWGGNGNT